METQPPVHQVISDPYAAIRFPEFRNLMLGRFIFIVALRMMSTLVAWWVYTLTNDPFAIGLVGLSEVIPAISTALYAGHVIDRSEKRSLLLRVILLYGCAAAVLLLFSSPVISNQYSSLSITIGIYIVIFCTGLIRSFTGATFSSMIASTVPRQYLQNATTWNQGSWLGGSVFGHAVAGFLIAKIDIMGTMITVCSLIAISFIFLLKIKPKPPLPQADKKTWESVMEGLRFVFRTKEILASFSLDMFAVLFGGAVAMVPVYAKDILKVGPMGFGWLNAAIDIGSIFIIILLAFFPMHKKQGKKLMWAVAGFGICIIVFALSESFIISFIAMLIAGMMDGISVVVRGTVMQLKTPDHMRGRVSSVGSMFINSSNELGQFESGMAARLMGVVPSVVFGGCMTLIVVIVTWFKAPTLRKFEY